MKSSNSGGSYFQPSSFSISARIFTSSLEFTWNFKRTACHPRVERGGFQKCKLRLALCEVVIDGADDATQPWLMYPAAVRESMTRGARKRVPAAVERPGCRLRSRRVAFHASHCCWFAGSNEDRPHRSSRVRQGLPSGCRGKYGSSHGRSKPEWSPTARLGLMPPVRRPKRDTPRRASFQDSDERGSAYTQLLQQVHMRTLAREAKPGLLRDGGSLAAHRPESGLWWADSQSVRSASLIGRSRRDRREKSH